MFNSIEDLLEESIAALDEEIKEVKKKGHGAKIALKDGILIFSEKGCFIYNFTLDDLSPIPDNTPVKLEVGNELFAGSILKTIGLEITLVLEENIGEEVPKAVMSASPERLLEALKERLTEVEKKEASFNLVSTKKLFGYESSAISLGDKPELTYGKEEPNSGQWEAIRHVLGSEVTFIWGPPGTGKTITLGRIVEVLLRDNRKILVLSHTNVATDKATEEIIKYSPSALEEGEIIRFGNIVGLKDEDKDKVSLDKIAERKSAGLRKEKESYEEQLDVLRDHLKTLQVELVFYKLRDDYIEKLQALERHLTANQTKMEALTNRIEHLNDLLALVSENLNRAIKAGKLIRFFKRLDPQKLALEKAELTTEIMRKERNLEELEEKRKSIIDEIGVVKRELGIVNNQIDYEAEGQKDWEIEPVIEGTNSDDPSQLIVICPTCGERWLVPNSYGEYICEECENEFKFSPVRKKEPIVPQRLKNEAKEISKNASDIEAIVKALEEKIEAVEDSVLQDAKVIVTSVTQAYLSEKIYGNKYDVLIVDEASMIPLPALFFASGLTKDKMVVIGDFYQLPPISISKNKLLKTDVFDYAWVKDKVKNREDDDRLVKLNEQYRMHPKIREITSRYVYEPNNPLKDAEKVKKEHPYLDKEPYKGCPVVFCDTSAINPWCNWTPYYSRFNLYNAMLTVNLLKEAGGDKDAKNKIGVITPYAAQSRLINKMLEQEGINLKSPEDRVKVSTIHRFQGLEQDVIIFDTVEGTGLRLGHFFYGDDESLRLINVAITRPKSKLIIIGNMKYLEGKLSKDALMYEIIQHIKNYGKVEKAEDIIAKYSEEMLLGTEKQKKAIPINLKGMSIFTQKDFYEMFEEDLLNAEEGENVVIFSPFLSLVRLGALIDVFRIVRDKGVNIIIVTRPRSKQGSLFQSQIDEAIEYMESIGIQVKRKRKMHYKRAFISNRIWWDGSLNIMAHRDTLEDMLRFEQKEIVESAIDAFGIRDLVSGKEEERKRWKAEIGDILSKFEERCDKCKEIMRVKFGKWGPFLACENRRCEYTKRIKFSLLKQAIEEANIPCPQCNGVIEVKYSRKMGHPFFGCSNYPDCKFVVPL